MHQGIDNYVLQNNLDCNNLELTNVKNIYTKSEVYTKAECDEKITEGFYDVDIINIDNPGDCSQPPIRLRNIEWLLYSEYEYFLCLRKVIYDNSLIDIYIDVDVLDANTNEKKTERKQYLQLS